MSEDWKPSFRARIIEDNRITIPKSIIESENLGKGDFVDVIIKKVEKGGDN